MELLLKATIDTAVQTQAIERHELECVIVDSTVQEKAIAHPTGSRLLEIGLHMVVSATRRLGFKLKQTFAAEGKEPGRRAGGYAHANQFRRVKNVVKRQRTILGIVIREVRRKLDAHPQPGHINAAPKAPTLTAMKTWLERAERIRKRHPKGKNKLYALHAPEVECSSKGKARKPYAFGVKVRLAVTHKGGLMVGARSFPCYPYDDHTPAEQLAQARNLCQAIGVQIKAAVVNLGYRGVDQDNPGVAIIHRGRFKSLTKPQRRWLKRRQAIEPAIWHAKSDHRMDRRWLQGVVGNGLHPLSCALGYNTRCLMRALKAKARRGLALLIGRASMGAKQAVHGPRCPSDRSPAADSLRRCTWLPFEPWADRRRPALS